MRLSLAPRAAARLPSIICMFFVLSDRLSAKSILSTLLRRNPRLFSNHTYSLRWTNLGTYPATFAIFQVHFHWNGLAYNAIRTIKPALKTAGFILLSWEAFLLVYFRLVITPIAGLASFTDTRRRFTAYVTAASCSHCFLILFCSRNLRYLVGFPYCCNVHIHVFFRESFSDYLFQVCHVE